MSAMPKPIVMDVDTGIDDALAILYAIAHPNLELLGISCVAGNAAIDQVVINTCKVLDAADADDIPVAAGAREPLIERARRKGGGSHGPNGLGGIQLPDSARRPSQLHAVELLHQLVMASPEPVSLVTLAPKTNVALLLTRYPDVTEGIGQIVFVGGSVKQDAEFNVWQDPEAAASVMESSIPTLMYGLHLFDRLLVDQAHIDRLRDHDHPAMRLAGDLLNVRRAGHNGPNHNFGLLGDAGALVLLTNPDHFGIEDLPVRVELQGAGRGQTIVDRGATVHDQSWPRVRVVLDLDVAKAASAFVEMIESYAPS
jgi:pyrimidine-specific ribonucleoside hydrolase